MPGDPQDAQTQIKTGHVEVDGLRIAYRQTGSGPPLVLLHGGWSDSRTWRTQIAGLSDGFTLIAWDAPGCGGSSDPPRHYRLPEYADILAGLIDRLGLERPHVLGLSFGGGLALELYRRHPQLPRSLILAGAYAGWAGSLPPDEVRKRLQKAEEDAERPPAEWIDDYLPTWFSENAPQHVLDEWTQMVLDARPKESLPMLQGFAEADVRDVLPKIDVPTLLVYGDNDTRAPLQVAKDLHDKIPGSRLRLIEGSGHVVNMEAPEGFNQEVRRFLQTVGP